MTEAFDRAYRESLVRRANQRVEYRNPFCDKPIHEHWTPTGFDLSDSLFKFGKHYDLRWEDLDTGEWVYREADMKVKRRARRDDTEG